VSLPKIHFRYPVYPDLTTPKGELPRDKRAQACWYFYTLAQNLYERLGKSTEDQFGLLETDLWMNPMYEQQARAVAQLYGLESPDEFGKFWSYVERQAKKMGLPQPKFVYKSPIKVVIH
jgi:hypothetical protein